VSPWFVIAHKNGFSNFSSLQKSKVSEAAVLCRIVVRGWNVFGAVFDGDKTDWLVETPDRKLSRLQVKLLSQKPYGLPGASLTSRGQRYQPGDFDFLIGYDLFSDTAFVWSEKELEGHKNTITSCDASREAWDKVYQG
jgi:hypothetical protein